MTHSHYHTIHMVGARWYLYCSIMANGMVVYKPSHSGKAKDSVPVIDLSVSFMPSLPEGSSF